MTNPTNQAGGVAEPDDAEGLLREYMAFVATTCISFPKLEERAKRLLAALATKPAAPAEVVAQWQIKNGGQWCNVDREPEELFKAKLPVRALYERTPAQAPSTGADK